MGLSPFEVLIKGIQGDFKETGDLTLRQQMQAFRLTLSKVNDWVQERFPVSLTTPTHTYRPGDAVWVKEWNVQPLKPYWRVLFVVVILSIPTTVKVAEIAPWIYCSRVKPASLEWECIPNSALLRKIILRNISTLLCQDPASWETTGDHENNTAALL
jgi:hypothetical protein